MSWKDIALPAGTKLYKSHKFNFMSKGATYHIEVDEFTDGSYSGHGEHSTDSSTVVASVSGASVVECLEALVKNIESK